MKKSLNILFIIDPFEELNLKTDATIFMMAEAHDRGHNVWTSNLADLTVQNGIPFGTLTRIEKITTAPKKWKEGIRRKMPLQKMQIILMRKDPPVNLDYITATYILSLINKKETFIMNNPGALRNFNEKMGIFYFPGATPPSIVGKRYEDFIRFQKEHKTIVLKPLEKMGGEEIIVLHRNDKNRNALLELLTRKQTRYIMAQRYLKKIAKGDKRIFLLDGKIVGSYVRIAHPTDHRSNLHAGGTLSPTILTKAEKRTGAKVGKALRKMGIYFAGLDMIGGQVTEINVTSPGGGFEIVNATAARRIEEKIVDFLEKMAP